MKATRWLVALAALVIVSLAAHQAQAGLADGLRNYWNLDQNTDDSAGTFAGNASTVSDNGTFDGAIGTNGIGYGPGFLGSAGLEQDGAAEGLRNNGFVRVPRSADTLFGGVNTLTTSFWVKAAGFDTNWQTMLAHGEGSNYRFARRGSDSVASYAGGSGDIPGSAVGPDLSDNNWHHVVGISEGGVSTRIWVDGSLVATGDPPTINDEGNSNPAGADLFIGANPQTGDNNREWLGELDDIAQWERVLDESEIGLIYQGGLAGDSLGTLIPEPASALLLLLGLTGLGLRRRSR